MQHINYCSHAEQLTFDCYKGGEGGIIAQLFILSYSDTVSFRDIKDHFGTIPSIVAFIYALVVEGDYSRVARQNPGE
jgi:hypothetical protein